MHERTWVEVDLSALEENVRVLRSYVWPAIVIAVLKGDAYGHGLIPCAHATRLAGAAMVAVGDASEASALRRAGDNGRLLVLGPSSMDEVLAAAQLQADVVLSDLGVLGALVKQDLSLPVRAHIMVDTGMGTGMTQRELATATRFLRSQERVKLVGLMSHLTGETSGQTPHLQLLRFRRLSRFASTRPYRHLANSTGIALGKSYFLNAVRPGQALYGISEACSSRLPLKPVLNWKASIVEVYRRPARTRIGYMPGHRLARRSLIGIVPVGYAHGYPRADSGFVLINGKRAPLIGRPNMLSMFVDLTDLEQTIPGEIVTLLGQDKGVCITAVELARRAGLIPNVFCSTLTRLTERRFADAHRRLGSPKRPVDAAKVEQSALMKKTWPTGRNEK